MKNKFLVAAILPVAGLALFGAEAAWAWGPMSGLGLSATQDEIVAGHQAMFEQKAKVLGVSVDEIKKAWAEGKTMLDLAKEKGLSAEDLQKKMQASRLDQMRSNLKVLVDRGVISQAQADQRIQAMQTKQAQGFGKMGRGMHRGLGF